jgi:hypothetical protein
MKLIGSGSKVLVNVGLVNKQDIDERVEALEGY